MAFNEIDEAMGQKIKSIKVYSLDFQRILAS